MLRGYQMTIDPRVSASLAMVARVMKDAYGPWWIIGSAAVMLHGGETGEIADIDVIVSSSDINRLYERLPLSNTPDETKRIFRSTRFGCWLEPPLNVEFMHGLEVHTGRGWQTVTLESAQAIKVGDYPVFVPSRNELIELLQLFGREKDIRRAATIGR